MLAPLCALVLGAATGCTAPNSAFRSYRVSCFCERLLPIECDPPATSARICRTTQCLLPEQPLPAPHRQARRPVCPPKRHVALVRRLSGTAPPELTTARAGCWLLARCRDPSSASRFRAPGRSQRTPLEEGDAPAIFCSQLFVAVRTSAECRSFVHRFGMHLVKPIETDAR